MSTVTPVRTSTALLGAGGCQYQYTQKQATTICQGTWNQPALDRTHACNRRKSTSKRAPHLRSLSSTTAHTSASPCAAELHGRWKVRAQGRPRNYTCAAPCITPSLLCHNSFLAKRTNKSVPTGVRFTREDRKILKALSAKLGVGTSQVLRLAIRTPAEIEQVGRCYVEDAVPVWQIAADLGKRIPKHVWAEVPRDLSKNIGHYLHGTRKGEGPRPHRLGRPRRTRSGRA